MPIDAIYESGVEVKEKCWPVTGGFHSLSPFRIVVIENQAEHNTISSMSGHTQVSIKLPFVPKQTHSLIASVRLFVAATGPRPPELESDAHCSALVEPE